MPPPKKPKNGPTRFEQFLSQEEIQKMEEAVSEVSAPSSLGASNTMGNGSSNCIEGSGSRKKSSRADSSEKRASSSSLLSSVVASSSSSAVKGESSSMTTTTTTTTASTSSLLSSVVAAASSSAVKHEGTAIFTSSTTTTGNSSGSRSVSVVGSGLVTAESEASDGPSGRGLLRELFSKSDPDLTHSEIHTSLPALDPDVPSPAKQSRIGSGKGRRFRVTAATEPSGAKPDDGVGGRGDHRQPKDNADAGQPSSYTSGASIDTFLFDEQRISGSGNGSSGSAPATETAVPRKDLLEHTYLTSLIKESPPSSGAVATAYLDRAGASTSGKMLRGLIGQGDAHVSAPSTFIHAALQLPLMDTSTSGHSVSRPNHTSMLSFLPGQGTHPHHPSIPNPPLPRCCGSSSLPLVNTNSTSVTSFSSSHTLSLSHTSSVQGSGSEPFDLSFKKPHSLCRSSNAAEIRNSSSSSSCSSSNNSAGSDKTTDLAPRPGSTGDSASSSFSPRTSNSNNNNAGNNNTSSSPSKGGRSTPSCRGDINGSPTTTGLSLTQSPQFMDVQASQMSTSPHTQHYLPESSPITSMSAAAAAPTRPATAAATQKSFSAASKSAAHDTAQNISRDLSDFECSHSEGLGQDRLASGVSGPSPGVGPGSGGLGTGAPGMPSQSLMSGSGHLQAPTSTTPDGGVGTGMHPNFLSMEPHPSAMGPGDISIKQEISAGSSTTAKLCQVCNDNASGFHYGVWSCEGCKAFFKRSIQGPVDYMCPATNNCTIDKHRRKSCQACRLRKCYEVGMNKGSQRKERKHSGGGGGGKGRRCRADSTDASVNSTIGGGASASKMARRARCAYILEALQKADLPVLESFHNHEAAPTRVHILNTLIKLADRELVYLINWAKHVPGYTDLSLSDQVHLIECCWMELLLLNCAFRSMDHEGKRLVFAPDFHLDRPLWNVTGMTEILEQVGAVSEQMVQYSVSKEELLLLQATVLVNAEVRRLASYSKIGEMQQMIVDALMDIAQRTHPENPRHVPSLILLLTHIRQAGERGIAYFQSLKREGCVTFCDLLTEMLDAHNSAAAAAASAAATTSAVTATVTMPSTSSVGVDQKNISPQQLAMGGTLITKRGSQEDNMNPYV